jgi:hypothetical protein
VKLVAGMSRLPEARIFMASTRNPLDTPSVPLKRKVIVFCPAWTEPEGNFMVSVRVEKPPPRPPKVFA